jgi:hypothetical protein
MTEDPRRYMQVAAALREQITDGQIKPGTPVPSIKTICRQGNPAPGERRPGDPCHGLGVLRRLVMNARRVYPCTVENSDD